MIITIDGYAGAGKSTAASNLARALGFHHLNTGAMYRAAAFVLQKQGIDIFADHPDMDTIGRVVADFRFEMTDDEVWLNGENLTEIVATEEMGRAASRVAGFRIVRERLKAEQHRFADFQDIVCEGRDQGTAVFPHAPVKFFFTAGVEIRARRRAAQDRTDPDIDLDELADLIERMRERDRQDEQRPFDPLRKAEDAIVIDTSHITPEEILARMLEVVEQCRSRN